MTVEEAELVRILKNHCQGLAAARTIEVLGRLLAERGFPVARRWIEATLHELVLRGQPVGTCCIGPAKGVFWIHSVQDWKAAFENIEMRFRPLAQRRAALLNLRRRSLRPLRLTDGRGREVRLEGGRIERAAVDAAGNLLLFDPAGQRAG